MLPETLHRGGLNEVIRRSALTTRRPRPHCARPRLRAMGICLGNARAYGSAAALRLELLQRPNLIVPLKKAKHFKYVKCCLIQL